jgi:hypothetical protein
MKTQSFTLRIPIDLLEVIKDRMGESTRSEFIIQALREALGVEPQQAGTDPRVADQLGRLLHEFEVFKTHVNGIESRVEKLEGSSKPVMAKPKAECKAIEKTESKTEMVENHSTLSAETAETEEVAEADLLDLLNKEKPAKPWEKERLRNYRRGSALKRRHAEGAQGFMYKGKDGKTHRWSVWRENLLPITPEDLSQAAVPAGPSEYDSQEFEQSFSSPHP